MANPRVKAYRKVSHIGMAATAQVHSPEGVRWFACPVRLVKSWKQAKKEILELRRTTIGGGKQ